MGRCSCGNLECVCNLTAGSGAVIITGTGDVATPWIISAPGETYQGIPIPAPGNIMYVARGKNKAPVPVSDLAHGDPAAVVLSATIRVPIPNITYTIRVDWHGQFAQPSLATMLLEGSVEIGGFGQPVPEYQQSQFGTAPTKPETRLQLGWVLDLIPPTCSIPINIYAITLDVGETARIDNQQMHIRGWFA